MVDLVETAFAKKIGFASTDALFANKQSMAGDLFTSLKAKIVGLQVPSHADKTLTIICGVVNLFFFGVGVMILGALNNDFADILIGLMQLFIPFVGWIWAIVWGILIIIKSTKG